MLIKQNLWQFLCMKGCSQMSPVQFTYVTCIILMGRVFLLFSRHPLILNIYFKLFYKILLLKFKTFIPFIQLFIIFPPIELVFNTT